VSILLFAAIIVAAAGTGIGCGGDRSEGPADGSRSVRAERYLHETMDGSTHFRETHLRCFRVEGPWTDACTFQRISLVAVDDDPLLVMGLRFEGDWPVGGTGTAPLDIACADDLPCWVRTLCRVTDQCTSGYDAEDTGPLLHTPTPTPERCLSAWNAHGGFSPDDVALAVPVHASLALGRPVYSPHLAGASLGFIGSRVEVRATADGCQARFDLGEAGAYLVTAEASGEARFWIWQGARDIEPGLVDGEWNACQRDDGTLSSSSSSSSSSSGSCPAGAVTPRAVADELERGHLQSLVDVGGIPYWLGRTFAGARPVPVEPPPSDAQSAVEYTNAAGGVDLLVLTYRPPNRSLTAKGVIVARAEPETATVLVIASREVPSDFSRAVRNALRPFISTNPDAVQVTGDLRGEPTRIDTSVPVRLLWVGPRFEGFTGSVVKDGPEGAAVVRYAKGGSEWFLVTYTARKKKHCGQTGCASPPPLPAVLQQYGRVVHTILRQNDLTVVLARRPRIVPHSNLLFEGLRPVR
jgi:hypothetical protein